MAHCAPEDDVAAFHALLAACRDVHTSPTSRKWWGMKKLGTWQWTAEAPCLPRWSRLLDKFRNIGEHPQTRRLQATTEITIIGIGR